MGSHRPTRSEEWTEILAEARRNPHYKRGWVKNGTAYGALFDLITSGRRVALDDGELTGNGHRWRWLVVDGDHIGRRESMPALVLLAKRCIGLDDEQLAALKSAEMDREDAMERRCAREED